jgi:recombination protein RecT
MSNAITVMKADLQKMQPEFAKVLPSHITPERFVRTCQTAVAFTRNIEKVTDKSSLLAACTMAAADGLTLDGREAALVVDYQGAVQYRPMMRGLLKLAYNSGQIKGIDVQLVRDKDEFVHSPTNFAEPIKHVINHRIDRGECYAVYAKAELIDGGIVHEVMNVHDINKIRDRSDAFKAFKAGKIKSTPWSTDWEEMARKTVFRRLSKYLPSSSDRDPLHQAAERYDDDYTFDAEVIDQPAPAKPARTKKAAEILNAETIDVTEDGEVIDAAGPVTEPAEGDVL